MLTLWVPMQDVFSREGARVWGRLQLGPCEQDAGPLARLLLTWAHHLQHAHVLPGAHSDRAAATLRYMFLNMYPSTSQCSIARHAAEVSAEQPQALLTQQALANGIKLWLHPALPLHPTTLKGKARSPSDYTKLLAAVVTSHSLTRAVYRMSLFNCRSVAKLCQVARHILLPYYSFAFY